MANPRIFQNIRQLENFYNRGDYTNIACPGYIKAEPHEDNHFFCLPGKDGRLVKIRQVPPTLTIRFHENFVLIDKNNVLVTGPTPTKGDRFVPHHWPKDKGGYSNDSFDQCMSWLNTALFNMATNYPDLDGRPPPSSPPTGLWDYTSPDDNIFHDKVLMPYCLHIVLGLTVKTAHFIPYSGSVAEKNLKIWVTTEKARQHEYILAWEV